MSHDVVLRFFILPVFFGLAYQVVRLRIAMAAFGVTLPTLPPYLCGFSSNRICMTIFVTFAGRSWREVTIFVSPVGFHPHVSDESPDAAGEFISAQGTAGDWIEGIQGKGMQ